MSAETQRDARLGTVLEGAYRITRLIGEGGMGAVYEAIQLRLNKRVAVKLMARQMAANRDALARFIREAEITSRLGHPNLVNVVDFGTSEAGEPYIVMEYLDGEDLDISLRRCGTLPVNLAVHITKQTASALAAAHAQGIVHRDLKPANVFLLHVPGELDFVKVLDFGISKVKSAGIKLTHASLAMGTPNYMSPEQAVGNVDEIDHQVDQWALACIAWEMLSGHCPFEADDVTALFFQIVNLSPQPLSPRVPDLDPEAEQVLLRALSKASKDRFPSIRDFARAFETAAVGRPADLTPTPTLSLRPGSRAGVVLELIKTSEVACASDPNPPIPLTTFYPTGDETSVAIPTMGRSRLGLNLVRAVAVLAGALVLLGAVLLLRPRSQSIPATAPPVRPSVAARPSVETMPQVLPLPLPLPRPRQMAETTKSAESVVKSAGGKAKPKKAQLRQTDDPFESAATQDKPNHPKAPPPPSDLLHRNQTEPELSPSQLNVKRSIIKEL
jgi:serine/threonine-protein kinase